MVVALALPVQHGGQAKDPHADPALLPDFSADRLRGRLEDVAAAAGQRPPGVGAVLDQQHPVAGVEQRAAHVHLGPGMAAVGRHDAA